jgi:hypothetical protein
MLSVCLFIFHLKFTSPSFEFIQNLDLTAVKNAFEIQRELFGLVEQSSCILYFVDPDNRLYEINYCHQPAKVSKLRQLDKTEKLIFYSQRITHDSSLTMPPLHTGKSVKYRGREIF